MSSAQCPCGSKITFTKCCKPLLEGKKADTAEQLMRSRYCAFVKADVDYILSSHHPSGRQELNRKDIQNWAENSKWLGLKIVSTEETSSTRSKVEFIANYEDADGVQKHHEMSEFRKKDGQWFFYDGKVLGEVIQREAPKVGRNDPCPCNSGKKYKKCCFAKSISAAQ